MPGYEYKVIPAPKKPSRIKGVRGTEAKFAASLAEIMNGLGRDGWEYQRADTLPCEERAGLTRRTTVFQNVLVFRREIADEPVEMSVRTPTEAPKLAADVVAQIEKQPEPDAPAVHRAAAADAPAEEPTQEVVPRTDDTPYVPPFRSMVTEQAAPALRATTQHTPEGKAPRVGAPNAGDGGKPVSAPNVAAP